jgi:hypothetical protein
MPEELLGQWIGDLRGTDIGKIYAVFVLNNGGLLATFTVNVDDNIHKGSGHVIVENGETSVELFEEAADAASTAPAKIVFDKITALHVAGRWRLANGHEGTLQLVRSETKPAATETFPTQLKPVEIVAREGKLSNVRLYRSELEVVVGRMLELAGGSNDVVVAATVDDRKQIKQFSRDFFARKDLPQCVTAINLSVNDGRHPVSNVLVVNLNDTIENTFFVQSENALWVSGSYAELDGLFRRYTNSISSFVHKYGLSANGLLLFVAIALLPEVPLVSRFVVLLLMLAVAVTIQLIHRSLTSTRVYLAPQFSRGFLSKVGPSLASALAAAAILGTIAWLYKAFPGLTRWLGFN